MADIIERVTLDRTTPDRAFANRISWTLKESGVVISASLTRVVLTLTPVSGGSPLVIDSASEGWGAGQPFTYADGVLTIDLSEVSTLTSGNYLAQLDVYDGSDWYAWGRTQQVRVVIED